MRIALISSGKRGPASYTLNLARSLQRRGHEVLLLSTCRWVKEPFEPMYEARSWAAFGMVPVVLSMRGVARRIQMFAPDVLHYQWPSGTSDFFLSQVLRTGFPTIATVHVSVDSHDVFYDRVFAWHYRRFLRHLPSLRGLISVSRFVAEQINQGLPRIHVAHSIIYAGIDETVFAPRPRSVTDHLRLLFVGQVNAEKGIDSLVEAALRVRRSRPLTLTVIGEGLRKSALQARTRGLDWIRWGGFLRNQADIAAQYAEADLTVLPTRWDEAFSLVPVESMACGTPVLATRKGGSPEIVIHGRTGYLISECDSDEIAETLLSVRTDELDAMRPQCRKTILGRHTLSSWCEAHERIYGSLTR